MAHLARSALSIGAAVALLAGCAGSQLPIGAPGAMPQSRAVASGRAAAHHGASPSYRVLYGFAGGSDGAEPYAGLVNVGGVLYGTTASAGGSGCGGLGCGVVYSITTSGAETVLWRFGGSPDGGEPRASLINVKGTLYGTTLLGGAYGGGTAYSISTSGAEKVLDSFSVGSGDGFYPFASLINVKGTLYGTTAGAGGSGCGASCGTVYSMSTTGVENVLWRFAGKPDGAVPLASLINVNGTLYGTTEYGGSSGDGTFFSITASGAEKVLYSFRGHPQGKRPEAALISVKGALYGTTGYGGRSGNGTVYRVSTSGAERVLHIFTGFPADGARPNASLLNVNGTLYGTTQNGGKYGIGTVYSISTSGTVHVLHSFGGGSDGQNPQASLTDVNGTLYGTTRFGGPCSTYLYGCGTVFALTP